MTRPSLARRLVGFSAVPFLAAMSPLIALPIVARTAGAGGWASAIAGESVGTFAAIALAFGWTSIGPARVAYVSRETRGRLYRESLAVRGLMSLLVLPAVVAICNWVATDGYELLTILMGLQGALIAISYTWFAVGVAEPGSILRFDAIPRLAAAILAATAIAATEVIEIYPAAGIAVTILGTGVYSRRVMREFPGKWPTRRELPRVFRSTASVAFNDAALGAYSSVPAPLVNISVPAPDSTAFASADKLVKLVQFLPHTLSNAMQAWTAESEGTARMMRLRRTIVAHLALGLSGWLGLVTLGPWASRFLFGDAGAAPQLLFAILGLGFAAYSMRTAVVRHVLFPLGEVRIVVVGTLTASAIGVPMMLTTVSTLGVVGVALGYAVTEVISTVVPLNRARSILREIRMSTQPLPSKEDPRWPPVTL